MLFVQVKRLKGQLEQKKQKNGTEDTSSPEGDVLENGADSNIMDIQSKDMPAHLEFRVKVYSLHHWPFLTGLVHYSSK